MNTAHTPGPWEFVAKLTTSENHKGFLVRAEKATKNGKWELAEIQPGDEDGELGFANAALIAAAPDLLAALRNLLDAPIGSCPFALDIGARKAIAKATGETA